MTRSSLACAFFFFLSTTVALAQREPRASSTGVQQAANPSITTDEAGGLIHLDAVVTGPSGAPVSGLRPEDFSLEDNGQTETILSFHATDNATPPAPPSRLILVLDIIDLMDPGVPKVLIRDETVAFEHYLLKNGGRLTRPVSVYLVDDRGLWTVAHPAGGGNAMANDILHNQLKLIRPFAPGPSTEINGGVAPRDTAAMSTLKSIGQIATEERRTPGRKLMLWVGPSWGIGPGLYNAHWTKENPLETRVWFSTLLREARITFYSFAFAEHDPRIAGPLGEGGDEPSAPPRVAYMSWDRKELAVESGGLSMSATSYGIVQQIEDCVRGADTFYTLTFDPAHADALNEYHDLKIVVNKPGLTVRTNGGYYDHAWFAVDRYPAARSVTVKQLEQMLAADRSASDAEFARQLAALELSERLSQTRVSALVARALGKRTREALRILADASVFFDPPADEIPATEPPDADAQRSMLALTAEYLTTTIHKLPNYRASQTTVRYQETPELARGSIDTFTRPLHVTDTLSATLYFRNSSEVAEPVKSRGRREKADDPQLATYGTFGPVLAGLRDALQRHADMTWLRWEQGAEGPIAVFRYAIPAQMSKYQAKACCLPDGDGTSVFLHYVGYRGRIAIDPQTGTIVRLAWSADLQSTTPIAQSKILIEYGPVEIGGTKYVCPVRGISLMRARSVAESSEWDESFLTYGPYATMLNEISFSNFRVFRSSARILPGLIPTPDDAQHR